MKETQCRQTLGRLYRWSLRLQVCKVLLATAGLARVTSAQDEARADSTTARWMVTLRNRAFIIPEQVVRGLPIQPTIGVAWVPSVRWRVSLDAQTVDNSGPGVQGTWIAERTVPNGGSGNFLQEWTLGVQRRFVPSRDASMQVRSEVSYSRAVRSYHAIERVTGEQFGGNRQRGVAAITIDLRRPSARGWGELGVAMVSLAESDAMYVRALPGESRGFGPLLGLRTAGSWQAVAGVELWGRAFIPAVGRNSIQRSTGRPARAVAFDVGGAVRLSPFAVGELFVSNSLGNAGALSMVADREYRALGTGLRLYPDARLAEGARTSLGVAAWRRTAPALAIPAVAAPTLGARSARARVRAGGQGLLASGEWAPVPGIQGGVFLDLLAGRRDEGELGALVRIGLREVADGRGRIALVLSGSRTNNPLVNLLAGDLREMERRGLPKGGFRFGNEDAYEGRLYVFTSSIGGDWSLSERTRLRGSLTGGYVQRNGLQIGGLAAGVERDLAGGLTVAADGGLPMGRRNVVLIGRRSYGVPWGLSAAWHPWHAAVHDRFALEAFVSNRAGESPFHVLRVRAGREVAVGAGVRFELR